MNLQNLFIVCSHGRRSAHGLTPAGEPAVASWQVEEWCPGGRPITLEDLGGEKVWWCENHKAPSDELQDPCLYEREWGSHRRSNCRISERILIPLPQMVAQAGEND